MKQAAAVQPSSLATIGNSPGGLDLTPENITRLIDSVIEGELMGVTLPDDTGDFVPTHASRVILSRLRVAEVEKFGFAVVHGPAGTGKSITTKWFVEQNDHVWLRAHPMYSPPSLLDDLAVSLRMTRVRKFRDLIGMVRDALILKPRIIAIDEAQLAIRETLETAKYLADETNSTFILITTDEFVSAIRRWRDIESRIGVVAGIGPMPKKEFLELYAESGFQKPTLEEIHSLAGGIMRDILRLVKQVDHLCRLNAEKGVTRAGFTDNQVRAAAQKLNLAGGRA
jgi:DNA transposition AAA+ family ATPase